MFHLYVIKVIWIIDISWLDSTKSLSLSEYTTCKGYKHYNWGYIEAYISPGYQLTNADTHMDFSNFFLNSVSIGFQTADLSLCIENISELSQCYLHCIFPKYSHCLLCFVYNNMCYPQALNDRMTVPYAMTTAWKNTNPCAHLWDTLEAHMFLFRFYISCRSSESKQGDSQFTPPTWLYSDTLHLPYILIARQMTKSFFLLDPTTYSTPNESWFVIV